MAVSDIPKGWKLEAVAPPEYFLRGPSKQYRENYDRIFGKKEEPEEKVQDIDAD